MEYHGGGRNIVQVMLSKAYYSDGCGRDGLVRERNLRAVGQPPLLRGEVEFYSLSPCLAKVTPQQTKRGAPKAEREDLTQLVLGLEDNSNECMLCSVCPIIL